MNEVQRAVFNFMMGCVIAFCLWGGFCLSTICIKLDDIISIMETR